MRAEGVLQAQGELGITQKTFQSPPAWAMVLWSGTGKQRNSFQTQ